MPNNFVGYEVFITARTGDGQEPEDPDKAILGRVLESIRPMLLAECSISAMATQIKDLDSFGSLRELLDELEFLDQWKITLRDGVSHSMPLDNKTMQVLAVQSFLHQVVDREGWYSASWYNEQFGIQTGTIRQAALRGQIPSHGEGKNKTYPFAIAKKLWPNSIRY